MAFPVVALLLLPSHRRGGSGSPDLPPVQGLQQLACANVSERVPAAESLFISSVILLEDSLSAWHMQTIPIID